MENRWMGGIGTLIFLIMFLGAIIVPILIDQEQQSSFEKSYRPFFTATCMKEGLSFERLSFLQFEDSFRIVCSEEHREFRVWSEINSGKFYSTKIYEMREIKQDIAKWNEQILREFDNGK